MNRTLKTAFRLNIRRRPSMASSVIRILIADNQILFRQSLRALLQAQADLTVVAETGDGIETVRLAEALAPDIVLLDQALTRLDGLEVVSTLRRKRPNIRTILLTGAMARNAQIAVLSRGARGVVLKDVSADLLCRSVRCVAAGQTWISRDVVSDLIDELADQRAGQAGSAESAPVALTNREWQILSHVAAGMPNKEIAARCACREDTVKHHLTRMFARTGTSNRSQLALFAVNQGVEGVGQGGPSNT